MNNKFESMLKLLIAIGEKYSGENLKEWIKNLDFDPEQLESLIEWAEEANPITVSRITFKPNSGMRETAIAQDVLYDGTHFGHEYADGDNEDLALANLFKALLSVNTDGVFITADHIS